MASYNKYKNENLEVELLKDYRYEKTINGGLEKDEIYNYRFSYIILKLNDDKISYLVE